MTKRERVIAALAGHEVDRGPTRLLMHNVASENSARGLAAETLRLGRTFDRDYLKSQSRAQCFAEMWGLTYCPSTERATPYTIRRHPARSAADLTRLAPVARETRRSSRRPPWRRRSPTPGIWHNTRSDLQGW